MRRTYCLPVPGLQLAVRVAERLAHVLDRGGPETYRQRLEEAERRRLEIALAVLRREAVDPGGDKLAIGRGIGSR